MRVKDSRFWVLHLFLPPFPHPLPFFLCCCCSFLFSCFSACPVCSFDTPTPCRESLSDCARLVYLACTYTFVTTVGFCRDQLMWDSHSNGQPTFGVVQGSIGVCSVLVAISASASYHRAHGVLRCGHVMMMDSENSLGLSSHGPPATLSPSLSFYLNYFCFVLFVQCVSSLFPFLSLPRFLEASCESVCVSGYLIARNGGVRGRGARPHKLVVSLCVTDTVPERCERACYPEIKSVHSNE